VRPILLNEPFRALFYAPFYVAQARGEYARQGIEVRMETAGDPAVAAANLLAGRADIAWSGPMRVILERSRDPASPLRSFCAVVMRDPFLLAGRAPRPDFRLEDLARLRLGSVSEVPTPWWCLQDDLRRLGVDPAALDRVADRPMAENAAAVLDGRLDVAQLFEPHAALVEARGGAVWHAAASRGPTAYSALYATQARIAERRAEFGAMVRALAAALSWTNAAAPDALAATLAPFFPDLPRETARAALVRCQALGLWSATPRFPRDAFGRLRDAMLSAGALEHAPSFEACVDEALVEEALAG